MQLARLTEKDNVAKLLEARALRMTLGQGSGYCIHTNCIDKTT